MVHGRTMSLRALLLALVVVAGCVVVPAVASAQSRSLVEGPSVRRQLLFRSARFELSPAAGVAFGQTYQRDLFVGVTGRYHLTNAFSAGVNALVGATAFDTSIAGNTEELDPLGARELNYTTQTLLTDVHLSYVPLSGKYNLFGSVIKHYDVYIAVGVGGALLSSDSDDLSGFQIGPAVTIGLRTFLSDRVALHLRVSDYLYASDDAQRIGRTSLGRPDPEPVEDVFRNHFVGMAGVSIVFPSEVAVSR